MLSSLNSLNPLSKLHRSLNKNTNFKCGDDLLGAYCKLTLIFKEMRTKEGCFCCWSTSLDLVSGAYCPSIEALECSLILYHGCKLPTALSQGKRSLCGCHHPATGFLFLWLELSQRARRLSSGIHSKSKQWIRSSKDSAVLQLEHFGHIVTIQIHTKASLNSGCIAEGPNTHL